MWASHDGMGWWWVYGGVWMIGFWAVIVGLVIWVVNRILNARVRDREENQSAVEIARRRLALGEITLEQYNELEGKLR